MGATETYLSENMKSVLRSQSRELRIAEIMDAEEFLEFFVNCYNLIPLLKSELTKLSRAAIRICGSVEPEPKEIFAAPQRCMKCFPHLKFCTPKEIFFIFFNGSIFAKKSFPISARGFQRNMYTYYFLTKFGENLFFTH